MTNDQVKLARKWAEDVMWSENASPGCINKRQVAAAEYILANVPAPTMVDVEWDDEKHHLAGATTTDGSEVVMLWHDDTETDHIVTDTGEWRRGQLTPNGKRYELREAGTVKESLTFHPATLTTLEDYENAPVGTVVEGADKLSWTRLEYIWKETAGANASDESMAVVPRRVLRWGWGD